MSEENNNSAVEESAAPVAANPESEAASESAADSGSIISKIVEGKVTHVASFGAFVKLENGEEGLVHISEVANEYVTDINEFVTAGEPITVKVLGRNQKGKLELSIRKAKGAEEKPTLFLKRKTQNSDFESKISQFLKKSEEKQIDVRRNLKNKQGISKKRR